MAKRNEDRCAGRRRMHANDLAPWVAEFRRHLSDRGHTALTVRGYDGAARHLAHWLVRAKVSVADIDESVIERFAQHRCRCPGDRRETHVSVRYVRRVCRFVEFLGERGIVQQKATRAVPVLDRRVVQFQDWLRQHRGISERTIDRHGRMVMRLLPALGDRPRGWDAHLVREVIMAETKRTSRAHVKTMAMALRGYLRFLSAHGFCRAGLEHAVPTIPEWRLSTLPRYIDAGQVGRLIATCDLTTPTGLRDRAILLLLARLGLRAGDIVSLRLGDLDWQQATLSVRGKGRRETRLPLPQDAGDAVLAYLERARPRVSLDRVFFMLNAPIRPLTSSGVVTSIVRSAIRKAGIDAPTKGASLLRHSAATAMLRGGATLDMVGTVLRHRSPDMTAHYAKVDVTMLHLIAATGIRIAEALALQLDDVTADGLVIRESKFQKSRLLPLHTTTRQALDGYLLARRQAAVVGRALFISVAGRSLPYNTVRNVFLQLLDRTELRGVHAGRDPRIHDLRHTFAVRSLEQCCHDRSAAARHLVALSTYLGHAHVTDTYWYLQATPVLMSQIAEAGEALLMGGAA